VSQNVKDYNGRKQRAKRLFSRQTIMDNELLRVWQLVHELSDQLAHNQKIASTLQSQAGVLKVCLCSTSYKNWRFSSNTKCFLESSCS
jgi:hypothetical protein